MMQMLIPKSPLFRPGLTKLQRGWYLDPHELLAVSADAHGLAAHPALLARSARPAGGRSQGL